MGAASKELLNPPSPRPPPARGGGMRANLMTFALPPGPHVNNISRYNDLHRPWDSATHEFYRRPWRLLGGLVIADSLICNRQPAIFNPHSALRTPHSALRIPHSAVRTPHSAFRTPHSAFRTPHSAFRTPHSAFSRGATPPFDKLRTPL